MEKTYTEKELQTMLKQSGYDLTFNTLDKEKVYIFRINSPAGSSKEQVHNLGLELKNTLDKLGIKNLILVDDLIEIYELEENKEKE